MPDRTEIHIGQEIRRILVMRGLSMKKFADMLCCERNSLYYLFSQPSIDIARLVRISEILEYDFLSLYTAPADVKKTEPTLIGIVRLLSSQRDDFLRQYPDARVEEFPSDV